jgi:hypothetical protein
LYLKGAALANDVHANPQNNLNLPFIFYANVGDSLYLNFVIGQTAAASAKDGLGRLIINIIADP